MMEPHLLDHLLAVVFAVGFPAICIPLYARRRPALEAGVEGVRVREYRETIAWLAGMGLATLAVWAALDRPWSALGLALPFSGRMLWAAAGLIAVLLFFAYQLRLVRTDPRARASVRSQTGDVDEFLPANERELRLFSLVATSAGIGEELFYRGFLLWYLATALPTAAAVIASSLLFGIAHLMHGLSATVRAAVLGAIFCGLYLWTGSLAVPIVLHAAIDWFSGQAAFAATAGAARA